MKQTTRTSRTAGYLEKMFRELNHDYFHNELDEPIITIQSTPRAYGHVTVGKTWKREDGTEQHELNIGAGTLNRPIENVVATMLHEMCHLLNLKRGIKDTSRGCTYHNKKFKEAAEAVDLHIEHDEKIGWSITSPTDKLFEYILDKGWTEILMNRDEPLTIRIGGGNGQSGADSDGGEKPKKSSTRKYQCPCCKNSVRATKTVNIICGDCQKQMIEV